LPRKPDRSYEYEIVKATHNKTKRGNDIARTGAVELIGRVADLCAADLSLAEALERLLEAVRSVVGFDAATLFLFDESHTRMSIGASIGPAVVDILGFLPLGPGHGLSGWVAMHDKPVLLADRSHTKGFDSEHDFASVAVLPLKTGDSVLGVLNIGCRKGGAISTEHIDALGSVTALLGLATECLTGHQAIRLMKEQIERAHTRAGAASKEIPPPESAALRQASESIYHEINDALAVIVGNAQCFLAEQTVLDQKTVSRVRRIQEAALKIRGINQKLPGLEKDLPGRRSGSKDVK
jgi:GAF domain-containing protein